jgi:hypothetical protein
MTPKLSAASPPTMMPMKKSAMPGAAPIAIPVIRRPVRDAISTSFDGASLSVQLSSHPLPSSRRITHFLTSKPCTRSACPSLNDRGAVYPPFGAAFVNGGTELRVASGQGIGRPPQSASRLSGLMGCGPTVALGDRRARGGRCRILVRPAPLKRVAVDEDDTYEPAKSTSNQKGLRPDSPSARASLHPFQRAVCSTVSVSPSRPVTVTRVYPNPPRSILNCKVSAGFRMPTSTTSWTIFATSASSRGWRSARRCAPSKSDVAVSLSETVTGAGSDQFIGDIAGGSLGVVAVGADGRVLEHDAAIWVSNDGLVWERLPHDAEVFGGEGDQFMHSVVQTSGSVIVVGESGGEAAAWVSRDGTQWARADVNDESIRAGAEPSVMNDVAIAGVGLVAVGSAGVDLGPAVWLSPDGVTWERLVDSMAGEQSGFSTDDSAMSPMTAVAAGERGLVAIGTKLRDASSSIYAGARWTAGPVVWTSDDGYEWQLVDSSFLEVTDQQETSRYAYLKGGTLVLLEDVAWDGDRMLAIGGYELIGSGTHDNPGFVTIWASTDGGSTWQVTGETTLPPTGSQSDRGARSFTRLGDSVVLVGSDDIPVGRHPEHGWMTYGSTPGVWIANLPAL